MNLRKIGSGRNLLKQVFLRTDSKVKMLTKEEELKTEKEPTKTLVRPSKFTARSQ